MLAPLITLFFVVVVPLAWFVSEFRAERGTRLVLGCVSIALCFGVAFVVASFDRFNSNAWFGFASKELIDAAVTELEAGRSEEVLKSLKALQEQYSPTYENRARYDVLVKAAVERMKSKHADAPETIDVPTNQ